MGNVKNQVTLIGRLTKDVELRHTAGKGVAFASMTIAIDDSYGEQKQTYFIPVLAWGKLAEWANQWLFKGKKIALSGKLTTRTWDDNDGKKHYITEVVADSFDFADDKKRDGTPPQHTPKEQLQAEFVPINDVDSDNPWMQPTPSPMPSQGDSRAQTNQTAGMPPWMQGKK